VTNFGARKESELAILENRKNAFVKQIHRPTCAEADLPLAHMLVPKMVKNGLNSVSIFLKDWLLERNKGYV
jgi:hypothetical protein